MVTRELFELLYGVPAIWALDQKAIKEQSPRLKKLADFFNNLHQSIFLLPLTEFIWLSEDKLLQQTTFDNNKVQVIANFSSEKRNNIPAHSLVVRWTEEKKEIFYTP